MNRTYLQAIALLMGTVATTFVAAEWRWEPANAGSYLVIVGPAASAGTNDISAGNVLRQHGVFDNRLLQSEQ